MAHSWLTKLATDVFNGFSGGSPRQIPTAEAQTWGSEVEDEIENRVPDTRQVIAGTALAGGGTLDADVTINADIADQATSEAGTVTDELMSPEGTAQAIAAQTGLSLTAVIEDQKAQNTAGGTFTSGAWQKRDLNTEVYDPDDKIAIASSEFTVDDDGWVEWSAPANEVGDHVSRLYNVTDAVVVGYGTASNSSTVEPSVTRSVGGGAVLAGKTYRIEHQCDTTKATDGFGQLHNLGTEVYSRVQYWT